MIPWTVDKEPHVRTEKTGSTTETLPCYSVDRRHDSYLVNCHKPAGSARSDSENLNFRLPASAIMPCQPSPIIVLSHFRHVPLFATPWTVAHQPPLSIGFSREEYWSRLPCPPPGDLTNPGIEPTALHWQAGSLSLVPPQFRNSL